MTKSPETGQEYAFLTNRLDPLLAPGLAQVQSKVAWGLLELTRLAQTMLLERCDLWAMLCPRPPG